MGTFVDDLVALWADQMPAAGYTGGHLAELTHLFVQTPSNVNCMRERIDTLRRRVGEVDDERLRTTAEAILTALRTQLDLARPSGAGPSGTGAGGVWAAADGVFYIVLKGDAKKPFVPEYLDAVRETVEFETKRWWGQGTTVAVKKECLNTVTYLNGTLDSLVAVRDDLGEKVRAIRVALEAYKALFAVPGLESDDFATYWPVFQAGDRVDGPAAAAGYPACIERYYQLPYSAEEIEVMAQAWLDLDLPVTTEIAERILGLGIVKSGERLDDVWAAVGTKYSVTADAAEIRKVENACGDFGREYVISFNPKTDRVDFTTTPSYLVNLVTGGEDFAVNYLDPETAYSQLYLTKAKNTSLLTMINILVHEASHGYNFVLSAKHAGSPLLNVNTSLEVAMTEGMAFYREYQYWAAAQNLVGRTDLNEVQSNYLALYGDSPSAQAEGVLCAQLETYIWRVIRYIRALCDVRVNGGKQTYTDFIAWAAEATGLREETLHGECFTFLGTPGYAPCYAVGGALYAKYQKRGVAHGVREIDFNTFTSRQGFYAWPIAERLMADYAGGAA